ncbi:hypothetical protein PSACC_02235 [Paramicrosporidium saccamoebae]|uniref:Uncharacterized protein n=1 Tax=Paramicrosporidium saccamoebae TaxID=1246581 RepID=A0A2H9TJV1_9FUNG|nr:hypothetical protein PSACC_02235 [Paramicrosporidium saccamoebae]
MLLISGPLNEFMWKIGLDELKVAVESINADEPASVALLVKFMCIPQFAMLPLSEFNEEWVVNLLVSIQDDSNIHSVFWNFDYSSHVYASVVAKIEKQQFHQGFSGIIRARDLQQDNTFTELDLMKSIGKHWHEYLPSGYFESPDFHRWKFISHDSTNNELDWFLYTELCRKIQPGYIRDDMSSIYSLRLWHLLMTSCTSINPDLILMGIASVGHPLLSMLATIATTKRVGDIHVLSEELLEALKTVQDRKEASMWYMDTLYALLGITKLSNICKMLTRALQNFEPHEIAPMSIRRILEHPMGKLLGRCPDLPKREWVHLFLSLIRFYPNNIYRSEPFESRYIRWQSAHVFPESGTRLVLRDEMCDLESVTTLLKSIELHHYPLQLDESCCFSHRGLVVVLKTVLDLANCFLESLKKEQVLGIIDDEHGRLIVDPNGEYMTLIFKAVQYKFLITGNWDDAIGSFIMEFWWSDHSQAQQHLTLMQEVYTKHGKTVPVGLTKLSFVHFKSLADYFYASDGIFRRF